MGKGEERAFDRGVNLINVQYMYVWNTTVKYYDAQLIYANKNHSRSFPETTEVNTSLINIHLLIKIHLNVDHSQPL
jgi:hypothetical protein